MMRKFLLLLLSVWLMTDAWAQERRITGRVVSQEDGTSLPGVNIVVKDTSIGTVTDAEGFYAITVPSSATTLVFSFIGLQSTEVPIDQRTVINVEMSADVSQLAEVVVTGMGIERSAKSLGYSVSKLSAEEISQGRTISPFNSLQGKVAGVTVSSASGAPGASTKIVVRGYSSIGGNNNALIVVDGIPINNSTNNFADPTNAASRTQDFGNRANDINPDDIESINILKGAQASALYGSRAGNGVIMITTKRAKMDEKIHVNFSSSAMYSSALKLPERQMTFGQGWNGHFAYEENGSWGPKMDGRLRLWGNVVDNSQQLKPFSPQPDNLKDFYDVGTSYMNTINVSGGTGKTGFYFSYANVKEDGIVPTANDAYKRNSFSFRGDTHGDKFSASYSVNYLNKKSKFITTGQGGDGTTMFQEIIQIPVDMSIVDFKDYKSDFNNLDNYFTEYAQNPYWSINENGNDFEENRVYGGTRLDYDIQDWLTASFRLGADVSSAQLKDWIAIASTDPKSPNAGQQQIPGRVDERTRSSRELYADFILNAERNISSDLKLTALGGLSIQERYAKELHTFVRGLTIPNFYNLSNSNSAPSSMTAELLSRMIGLYSQATFSYKDYLFLTVTGRNDWSSTLPTQNNSFFYPGANASFVFTDAMHISGPISMGKVRVSYGQTGNDAQPYSVHSTMEQGTIGLPFGEIALPLGGVNGYTIADQLGNEELTPEITTELELGTNVQFLNNRLGFDIAYYDAVTKDQIFAVPMATSSGYRTKILNFGKVQNRGIELLVNVQPIQRNNFSWDISVNYSRNRNEVLELSEGLDRVQLAAAYSTEFVAEVGSPLGTFYGPAPLTDSQGRIVVSENNGIPITSPTNVKYGDAQANYVMGINNQFSYKNLSLSFGFDIRQGGLMYSYTKRLMYFVGNATQTTYNDRQPFIVPNSVYQPIDPNTNKPAVDEEGNAIYVENDNAVDVSDVATYFNETSNKGVSRDMVIDRSYVKLREVVLNYSLPTSWLAKTPVKSLDISFVGRNLLIWTPASNNIVDPESTTFGNDLRGDFGEFAVGPTVRSMGFSVKASF